MQQLQWPGIAVNFAELLVTANFQLNMLALIASYQQARVELLINKGGAIACFTRTLH